MNDITNPQIDTLQHLYDSDMTYSELAQQLGISANAVHSRIKRVRRYLGIRTNFGAIKQGLRRGLIYD